jgi:hypothetical protein
MPRNLECWWPAVVGLGFATGCAFDADYQSGHTTCSDGLCPSGLACSTSHECVVPTGATDAASADGHVAALVCSDPGELASGIATNGTTVGRTDAVSATCAGVVMNGPDAEYAIAIASGQSLVIGVAGSYAVSAYVLAACEPAPATPACVGNIYTTSGIAAATISPGAAGTYYVVVDGIDAALTGTYTLTVTAE